MPASRSARGYLPGASRTAVLLTSAIAALFGSATRLPAQTPSATEKTATKPAQPGKRPAPEFEPFDLSYMPTRATSLVAIRPAALARRVDLRPCIEAIRGSAEECLREDAGLVLPIKLEMIEQIALGLIDPPPTGDKDREKDHPDEEDGRFCLQVRMAQDVDWGKAIEGLSLALADDKHALIEVRFEGKTYRTTKKADADPGDLAGGSFCFFFPDARTAVVADEKSLREVIRRPAGEQPELARGDAWQEIRRGLVAFAADKRTPSEAPEEISDIVVLFVMDSLSLATKSPYRIHGGIQGDDTLTMHIREDLGDAKQASASAHDRLRLLATQRLAFRLAGMDEPDTPDDPFLLFAKDLASHCRIRADGPTVAIDVRCPLHLGDLVRAFSSTVNSLAKEAKEAAAKPAQRVIR